MTRRKKDATVRVNDIKDVISPFVDPTDVVSVKILGLDIIVNTTQVSNEHLAGLEAALAPTEYNLVRVHGHPDTHTPEFQDIGVIEEITEE